jgi:RNA polymerase subunit RPABC4/transcription elongation factor Spt4
MPTCGKCGALVLPGMPTCDRCGAPMGDPSSMNPGRDDSFNPFCNDQGNGCKVDSFHETIPVTPIQEQYASPVPRKTCINCGAALDEDSVFCPECGRDRNGATGLREQPIKPEPRRCEYCDSELEEDDTFCQECGKPVSDIASATGRRCSECGSALEDDSMFCSECGSKVNCRPSAPSPVRTRYKPSGSFNDSSKMIAKWLVLIVGLVLVGAGAMVCITLYNLPLSLGIWGLGLAMSCAGLYLNKKNGKPAKTYTD